MNTNARTVDAAAFGTGQQPTGIAENLTAAAFFPCRRRAGGGFRFAFAFASGLVADEAALAGLRDTMVFLEP